MKPKTKENKVKRLTQQWFALDGNPEKQKRISGRIETLNKTKK